MVTDTLDFMVSAGHDEYPLDLTPFSSDGTRQMINVWPGPTFDVYQWGDDPANKGVDISTKWTEVTGLPESQRPDADLYWEAIYHVTAQRAAVEHALECLIDDIAIEPGGDDDTFDYWPSGVRLALAVAEHLGPEWVKRVEDTARLIITVHKPDFADELFDKTGVGR